MFCLATVCTTEISHPTIVFFVAALLSRIEARRTPKDGVSIRLEVWSSAPYHLSSPLFVACSAATYIKQRSRLHFHFQPRGSLSRRRRLRQHKTQNPMAATKTSHVLPPSTKKRREKKEENIIMEKMLERILWGRQWNRKQNLGPRAEFQTMTLVVVSKDLEERGVPR